MATDSRTKSLLCLKAAIEKKALNPVLLELKEITSFTDYFLLLTGKSDRQVQAIAQAIEEALKKEGDSASGSRRNARGKVGLDGLRRCGGPYLSGTDSKLL